MIEEAYTELANARAEKDDSAAAIPEVGQAVSVTGEIVPLPFPEPAPIAVIDEAVNQVAADGGPPASPSVFAPEGEGGTRYTWGDKTVWFPGEHSAADVAKAFEAQG